MSSKIDEVDLLFRSSQKPLKQSTYAQGKPSVGKKLNSFAEDFDQSPSSSMSSLTNSLTVRSIDPSKAMTERSAEQSPFMSSLKSKLPEETTTKNMSNLSKNLKEADGKWVRKNSGRQQLNDEVFNVAVENLSDDSAEEKALEKKSMLSLGRNDSEHGMAEACSGASHRNNLVQASGVINQVDNGAGNNDHTDTGHNSAETLTAIREKVGEAAFRRFLEEKKRARSQRQQQQENEERLKKVEDRKRLSRQRAAAEMRRYRRPNAALAETKHKQQVIAEELARAEKKLQREKPQREKPSRALHSHRSSSPQSPRLGQRHKARDEVTWSHLPTVDGHGQDAEPEKSLANDGADEEQWPRKQPTEPAETTSSLGLETSIKSTGARSTLDELMETLSRLEQDDASADKPASDASLNRLDGSIGNSSANAATNEALYSAGNSRLGRVLNYLSDVEAENRLTDLEKHQMQSEISSLDNVRRATEQSAAQLAGAGKATLTATESNRSVVNSGLNDPATLDRMKQLSETASEVTGQMLSQRLELEEKTRSLEMVQKALDQQRELTRRNQQANELDVQRRLETQKSEYEDTINRHLAFIDELIAKQKELSSRCETLVLELKRSSQKNTDNVAKIKNDHAMEIQKLKETFKAEEKLRREKWVVEQRRHIKEMTVKGLAPEIERLIAKHQEEIRKLKSIHEAEMLQSDERAAQKYVSMTEELRTQLENERDQAIDRERALARERYEKQLRDEEQSYQQQRRRLYQEVQDEKDRLQEQTARQRAELEKTQTRLEDSHLEAIEAMRAEFDKARQEQDNRHKTELREAEQRYKIEKEAWEENQMKKQETWMMAKEREIREQLRQERDKELEIVVARLETDQQQSLEDNERQTEHRIRRIREKYENEVAELERSERQTMSRYNEIKVRVAELEGENERLKVSLRQSSTDYEQLEARLSKLSAERERVTDVVREEFADRLVQLENDNIRLRQEMAELKSRHRTELARVNAEKTELADRKELELAEVHRKVKAAVEKKDEIVAQKKAQCEAAMQRCEYLEGLLDEQRKLIASKQSSASTQPAKSAGAPTPSGRRR